MPQYMLMIYNSAGQRPSPEALAEDLPKWGAYTETLKGDGVYVNGDALQGVEAATTVRSRDGEVQLIDGPFAETKEYLGGYYVIETRDLDQALEYASRMPNLHYGCVEVRPIWDLTQMTESFTQPQAQAQA
jgi:hypothetical protein